MKMSGLGVGMVLNMLGFMFHVFAITVCGNAGKQEHASERGALAEFGGKEKQSKSQQKTRKSQKFSSPLCNKTKADGKQ
jgi:hypothetical protein